MGIMEKVPVKFFTWNFFWLQADKNHPLRYLLNSVKFEKK